MKKAISVYTLVLMIVIGTTYAYGEENASNPLSLICLLSAHPEVGKLYKLGNLTPFALGDCYAIFFTKEEQVIERSEEIRGKIFQFRAEQAKKLPLS